jgi:hypothetical protein
MTVQSRSGSARLLLSRPGRLSLASTPHPSPLTSLLAPQPAQVVSKASEEDEVTRRKREGTPVTVDGFMAWRARFEAEAEARRLADDEA